MSFDKEEKMTFSKRSIIVVFASLLLAAPLYAGAKLTFQPTTFESASGKKVHAEIGTLVVPENRHAKSSRTIDLKLIRFRSTSKKPGSPIVYLAGGPGGSGIDAAKGSRFPPFMALREFGDVIALDQRGTGKSEPSTRCTETYSIPFTKPIDRQEAEGAFAAGMTKCFDRLRDEGIDPAAYTTPESADDLEDLREALGAKKITLWGISYGTHLALATLRAHGDHIDRAILAGVEPLDHTYKLPSDQQALLDRISELVKRDPATRKAIPDLEGTIARVLEKLREKPASVTLVHPVTHQPVDVAVGPFGLQFVLAEMLRGPESFAMMPDLVSRLDGGDWTALALMTGRYRIGHLPSAMSVAMDCASGESAAWRKRIASEAKNTLLGDAINFPFPGICRGLDVPDLGDAYRKPVHSDVPVLLIAGTLDGRTPVRNAEEVMKGLPNAQELVIDGAGHSDPLFLSSPKILDDMKAFLAGKKIPEPRIALAPVRFVPPREVVELSDEILSRYAGTYRIKGNDVRRVVKAGPILFTIRGHGEPYPLRPMSKTDFFWEGLPGTLHFDVSPEGKVLGMTVHLDGMGKKGEKATKLDLKR